MKGVCRTGGLLYPYDVQCFYSFHLFTRVLLQGLFCWRLPFIHIHRCTCATPFQAVDRWRWTAGRSYQRSNRHIRSGSPPPTSSIPSLP
jgi:hypothetical protein